MFQHPVPKITSYTELILNFLYGWMLTFFEKMKIREQLMCLNTFRRDLTTGIEFSEFQREPKQIQSGAEPSLHLCFPCPVDTTDPRPM